MRECAWCGEDESFREPPDRDARSKKDVGNHRTGKSDACHGGLLWGATGAQYTEQNHAPAYESPDDGGEPKEAYQDSSDCVHLAEVSIIEADLG